jgi:hypothetical protein
MLARKALDLAALHGIFAAYDGRSNRVFVINADGAGSVP